MSERRFKPDIQILATFGGYRPIFLSFTSLCWTATLYWIRTFKFS